LTVHVLTTVGVFGADLVLLTLGLSAVFGADARTLLVINVALAIYTPRWRLRTSTPERSPSLPRHA
jgi:hypothetical protein